jgi:repressor LexA
MLKRIRDFMSRQGYPPTVRELADMSGQASTAGVHKMLNTLVEKGYISRRGKGKSRTLELLVDGARQTRRARAYPILGRVSAGVPDLAVEDFEGEIELDRGLAGEADSFVLRVRGYSMIDADIRDGDMIVVEKTSSCRNGDVVIAVLEGEATVKRFFKEKDRIRLQPENPTMHPIYVNVSDPGFHIIGRVRTLLRKY